MSKVKMSNVWDRTTEVLSGRAGALAGIAFTTLFAPLVLMLGYTTTVQPRTPQQLVVLLVLLVLVAVVGVLGALAMIALASEPATTRADAWRQARSRVVPLIGVSLVLVAIALLAFSPVFVAIAHAKGAMATLAATGMPAKLSGGTVAFVSIYYFVLLAFLIWASARLSVLNAVVLHERRGLGAIRRSFALTRGITWRLIGVLLLYVVVLFIARAAVQSVVGVILRLALGPAQIDTALFVAGVCGAVVTTLFTILAVTFTAQLYVATTAAQPTEA